MTGDSSDERQRSRRDLSVVFELGLSPASDCPFAELTHEIEDVRQQLVGDDCHTDTIVHTDDCGCVSSRECTEVVHTESRIDEACPCGVFGEFGCVPELVDTTDGCMIVETYLSDRERLTDLVNRLNEVTDALRLRKLKRIDNGTAERHRDTVTLDLIEVTEKQREAVTQAVSAGYYSSPRETSLGELADELDISKSALTQRLNSVESKLATTAFTEMSSDR